MRCVWKGEVMDVWKIGSNFSENNERMKRHLSGNWGADFRLNHSVTVQFYTTYGYFNSKCFYFEMLYLKKNVWLLCLSFVFHAPCCSLFYMSNVNRWFLQLCTCLNWKFGKFKVWVCVCWGGFGGILEEEQQQEYIIFSRIPSVQEANIT